MSSRFFWKLIVGLLIIGILVGLFIWSDGISSENLGPSYQTEKLVRSILMVFAAWVATRFITLIFLDPINKRRKRALPNIVKDIIGAIIYFIALLIIVVFVYGKDPSNIGMFLISSWAIIGFAAHDLIGDCIHGISLDLQADFEIGDWIEFKDGTKGKIIEMKMTGVDILLQNDTVLFISNTMLNSDPMINLSKPERDYYEIIKVVLEHSVPVGRGRRILLAAATSASGVYNHGIMVFAESVQTNGISYEIWYRVPDRDLWLECRHQVIKTITEYLHKFDMRICQIIGELDIKHRAAPPKSIPFDDAHVVDPLTALKMSQLLDGCDERIKVEFANKMVLRRFEDGATIVKQGDSGHTMFIVAEGVVEVGIEIGLNRDKNRDGLEDTEERKAACLVDGEYFGENALLLGETRNASVVAKTDVVLYEIDRQNVKEFISRYPSFADELSEAIIRRQAKNSALENIVLQEKANEEKAVSEFVMAFKKYLWDH